MILTNATNTTQILIQQGTVGYGPIFPIILIIVGVGILVYIIYQLMKPLEENYDGGQR